MLSTMTYSGNCPPVISLQSPVQKAQTQSPEQIPDGYSNTDTKKQKQ